MTEIQSRAHPSLPRTDSPDTGELRRGLLPDIFAVLAVALVVQMLMLRPPFPSDSLAYFKWASLLTANSPSHGTTRWGVLLPVRGAIELFGYSEAAYYLVPLVSTLGTIVGTYLIGRLVSSRLAGWVAAILMTCSILFLDLSSQITPDTFASAWFVVSMVLLLSRSLTKWPLLHLAGSGLCLGLAYACREYVLFLIPVIALVAYRQGWKARELIVFVAPILGLVVMEMVLMSVLFEDPFARWRALLGFSERGATGGSLLLQQYGAGATRWDVLRRSPNEFAQSRVGTLLVVSVPLSILAAFLDRRARASYRMFLVWVLSLWIPMMLLAGIVDPAHPRIRDNHIRYWFLLLPALYLLVGSLVGSIAKVAKRQWARTTVIAIAGVLLASWAVSDFTELPSGERFLGKGATQWYEVRDWLRDAGDGVDTIYIDERMSRVLPLYTVEIFGSPVWSGDIELFESGGEFRPRGAMNGAIVIHELGTRYLANRGLQIPDEYDSESHDWQFALRRADSTLRILVDGNGGPE